MAEYVFQVKNDNQQLIKSYEVSAESPIRPIEEVHAIGRKQIVITDTDLFNQVLGVYAEYKLDAKFTLDEATNDITWEIT
jgi:hypothetical protein